MNRYKKAIVFPDMEEFIPDVDDTTSLRELEEMEMPPDAPFDEQGRPMRKGETVFYGVDGAQKYSAYIPTGYPGGMEHVIRTRLLPSDPGPGYSLRELEDDPTLLGEDNIKHCIGGDLSNYEWKERIHGEDYFVSIGKDGRRIMAKVLNPGDAKRSFTVDSGLIIDEPNRGYSHDKFNRKIPSNVIYNLKKGLYIAFINNSTISTTRLYPDDPYVPEKVQRKYSLIEMMDNPELCKYWVSTSNKMQKILEYCSNGIPLNTIPISEDVVFWSNGINEKYISKQYKNPIIVLQQLNREIVGPAKIGDYDPGKLTITIPKVLGCDPRTIWVTLDSNIKRVDGVLYTMMTVDCDGQRYDTANWL